MASAEVGCIEVKLSQGAKPGLGGVLPGKKVTPAIAEARGVEIGQTVFSPNRHSAFHDVDGLIDFVETIAEATGLTRGHQVCGWPAGVLGRTCPTHGRPEPGP